MMISLDPKVILIAENQAKAGDASGKTARRNQIQMKK